MRSSRAELWPSLTEVTEKRKFTEMLVADEVTSAVEVPSLEVR
jgi:hypothetical protein